MELIDKIKPLLGTETILIIDSNEHYLKIHDKLGKSYLTKEFFVNHNSNVSINLTDCCWSEETYYRGEYSFRVYKFIHTSELLEFNDWLWN